MERRPLLVHVLTSAQATIFLRGQAGYLRPRGFETQVIASDGPELGRFAAEEGVRTLAVQMPRRITIGEDLRAGATLWRYFRQVRPTIVHGHTPKGGLLGMIAAVLAGVPVRIYQMHGLPFSTATGARRTLLQTTERVACRLAHRVICVSPSVQQLAIETGLCPPEKTVVLGAGSANGVDDEGAFNPARFDAGARTAARAALGLPPDAFVIGFVGRIVRDKGIVELARAWQTVRKEIPEARLLLVGTPEPQDPVPPAVLDALRADDRTVLAGERLDMPPVFAAMDLAVLPTYREGFPNVLLEAAAMALPVVATRVTGCVDAVCDGQTGLLVPAHDADALAAALLAYYRNPALRRAHGEAARARVCAEFQQRALWERLEALYRSLLGPAFSHA